MRIRHHRRDYRGAVWGILTRLWRPIDEAVSGLVDALPDAERRLVVQMAAPRARVQLGEA